MTAARRQQTRNTPAAPPPAAPIEHHGRQQAASDHPAGQPEHQVGRRQAPDNEQTSTSASASQENPIVRQQSGASQAIAWRPANAETKSETSTKTIRQHQHPGPMAPKPAAAAAAAVAPVAVVAGEVASGQGKLNAANNNSKFQQRQQKFLAAAAKSSTPGHLRRQQQAEAAVAAAAAAGGRQSLEAADSRRLRESAWRTPLLPTLLARVKNSSHICRPQQQQQQQQREPAANERATSAKTASGAQEQQQQQLQQRRPNSWSLSKCQVNDERASASVEAECGCSGSSSSSNQQQQLCSSEREREDERAGAAETAAQMVVAAAAAAAASAPVASQDAAAAAVVAMKPTSDSCATTAAASAANVIRQSDCVVSANSEQQLQTPPGPKLRRQQQQQQQTQPRQQQQQQQAEVRRAGEIDDQVRRESDGREQRQFQLQSPKQQQQQQAAPSADQDQLENNCLPSSTVGHRPTLSDCRPERQSLLQQAGPSSTTTHFGAELSLLSPSSSSPLPPPPPSLASSSSSSLAPFSNTSSSLLHANQQHNHQPDYIDEQDTELFNYTLLDSNNKTTKQQHLSHTNTNTDTTTTAQPISHPSQQRQYLAKDRHLEANKNSDQTKSLQVIDSKCAKNTNNLVSTIAAASTNNPTTSQNSDTTSAAKTSLNQQSPQESTNNDCSDRSLHNQQQQHNKIHNNNHRGLNTLVSSRQSLQQQRVNTGESVNINHCQHQGSIVRQRQQQIYNNINNTTNINNIKTNQGNSYYSYYHPHHNINNNHHQYQQQAQPLQRNIMAHYKFHNDCQSTVLTYEQVKRLDSVMDQIVPIHGRGNSPTLYVKLKELIRLVKHKLQKEHSIEIRDVRLNGGCASYVLAPENSHYNDLDLIFGTDLSDESRFDVIRDVVLECLMEFYPGKQQQRQHQHQQNQHHSCGQYTEEAKLTTKEVSSDDRLSHHGCTTDDHDDDLKEIPRGSSPLVTLDNVKISPVSQLVNQMTGSNTDEDPKSKTSSDEDGKEQAIPSTKCDSNERVPCERSERQERFKAAVNSNAPINVMNSQVKNYNTIQQQMPLNNCAVKEAYVHKMVKVNDDDRWSLISLGVQQSEATSCLPQQQQHRQLSGHTSANQVHQPTSVYAISNSQPAALDDQTMRAQQECGASCAEHDQFMKQQQRQERQNFNHNQQQKQFPISIELKFVDKMRRKFEFSVDSFQIILDSLIEFYDLVPRSTITIQRGPTNSKAAQASILNRTQLLSDEHYLGCCHTQDSVDPDCAMCAHEGSMHLKRSKGIRNVKYQMTNDCLDSTAKELKRRTCSSSYYHLPLQSSGSPSNSIASSSGCSSSSSVVSSSSSSLSCDEEQDELYCDGDSPPSSSASTSSLLSSNTVSTLSSSSTGATSKHGSEQKSSKYAPAKANDKSSNNLKLSEVQRISNSSTNLSKIQFDHCGDCVVDDEKKDRSDLDGSHIKSIATASCAVISENFYPTVIGHSEYGNFKEALYHLEKKLIATRSPEEIRGGGLLKYCNLLVKNYKPTNGYQIRTLERYMCSRFFIDFSDLNQQRAKLESYLTNHFSDDPMQKYDYLTILYNVVQRSTVCLMNHELRLTLNMIRDLAFKLNEQQHAQGLNQQQQMSKTVSNVLQQQHPQQQQQQHNNKTQAHQQQQPTSQEQQRYYQQQDPVVMQSGAYRVKLVNYALTKPVKS